MDESSQPSLRIALAQLNPTVGDITGNSGLIGHAIAAARDAGADLVLLPELVITGYPPEDLLLKRHFLAAASAAVDELAAEVTGITALVGTPWRDPETGRLHNALAVLGGDRPACYAKVRLPNYGVFDEGRYFEPGPGGALIEIGGTLVGLTVCEDIWFPGGPALQEAAAGAALVLNASASPYHRGKGLERERMVATRAREAGVAFALCNMVGGQDELVFDGHSFVVDAGGRTLARAVQFEEELLLCDLELERGSDGGPARTPIASGPRVRRESRTPLSARVDAPLGDEAEVYAALRLGLADYVHKNNFTRVVLGLSGGVDSALVAALAVDALGAEAVSAVVMPSPHSSAETQGDARRLAANLGCELIELPIGALMEAYEQALGEILSSQEVGTPEENLQARIRGNIVMALSNKFGWLPLTTGNKSELSVGYSTLYGDMAGGLAVIRDVPKLLVYDLVRWRNAKAGFELIPASIIERAPSAELRPGQRDSDSLPPYEVLDPALTEYVERDGGRGGMVAAGTPEAVAERVIALVDRAEYKRRQAPPGIRITPKAFGRDRRMPITNRFGG